METNAGYVCSPAKGEDRRHRWESEDPHARARPRLPRGNLLDGDLHLPVDPRHGVDDITAYVEGAEAAKTLAREGARLTMLYEQCGFEINRKKSSCAATSPETEHEMVEGAAALGLQVQGALKELGVVHGTTSRATVMARARWHDTCTRLGRIGRMAIPG